MASTLVKNTIHLIFHVKSTSVTLRSDDLDRVHSYIGGVIKNLGGVPYAVGGVGDHVHILATLPKTMALSDYVRTVKAGSSQMIHQLDAHYRTFEWQEGYAAFSVSPSVEEKTRVYIMTQVEHHRKRTFREEVEAFFKAYDMQYDDRYAFSD